jgi:hypothetical protein
MEAPWIAGCIVFGALFLTVGLAMLWGTAGILVGLGLALLLVGSTLMATVK